MTDPAATTPLLNDEEVRMLLDYVAATVLLLDAVDTALADIHLGYNSSVPTDARLKVGPIGHAAVRDLRRVRRRADQARKLLGKRRAITGVKIVTLAYEEAPDA